MTWLPSVSGKTIALLTPRADQVDFVEEAHALSHINRYNGHGSTPCSVARHKLIGLALCPEALRPHWLVHDIHETRLGDIARPTLETLIAIAGDMFDAGNVVEEAVREFKIRHDRVIHAAAGLPMPTGAAVLQIEAVDLKCLATEHRDFHRPSAQKWAHEIRGITPGPTVHRFAPPVKVAEQLVAAFGRYLPALRGTAAPRLFEEA